MSSSKLLNRCDLIVDYYAYSPPIKIDTECGNRGARQLCAYFVPKTKRPDEHRCKYQRCHGVECHCPEARVDAAKKILAALTRRVIDRGGR
jgi:hypothetical protein